MQWTSFIQICIGTIPVSLPGELIDAGKTIEIYNEVMNNINNK